ncbi:MAG: PSD1 domain-containing protein [Candidatus Hydrogenedentes bacterium]|nr:PSD1 domain-containing protein [Candidatus Hydrogenedentota bacterium]
MRAGAAIRTAIVLACSGAVCLGGAADSPRFSRDILPILSENCFHCHGMDAGTRKAGLRLDTEEGAAAVLGQGAGRSASALFQRITDPGADKMPPPDSGKTLSPAQIDLIGQWLDGGAPWEGHWAYTPPVRVVPAPVRNAAWPRSPIDRYILARLESAGFAPAPEADRRTLFRRIHLDLTGLPPAPDAADRFVLDNRPDAWERLVDELLASPHFGEHWARWWLDLAMYADSDGYLSDFIRPNAWRYRQWVVDALNADMPFDQFTVRQIAGDRLPNATVQDHIATGFLRNTLSNREGGAALEEFRTLQTFDRTRNLGTVWLGLTLECAQCHDHKYDAISQRDYFQIYAFFNNADEVNVDAPLGEEAAARAAAWPGYVARREALLAPVAGELDALQARWEEKLLHAARNPGGPDARWDRAWEVLGLVWGQGDAGAEGQLEGAIIVQTPPADRTQTDRFRIQNYFLRHGELMDPEAFQALKVGEIVRELDALAGELPPMSRAPAMRAARVSRPNRILERGDFRTPGAPVTPGVPAVLSAIHAPADPNRLNLARWLVAPENPLTARVTVNRIWQQLFGQGLVTTPDDFGVRGALPSHPDLLDWLAISFREDGWSLKALLREIVLSSTYRQSSHARPDLRAADPSNALLGRQQRLRLTGEQVRDAALSASGLLHPALGGPSVRPPQPESVTKEGFDNAWVPSEGPDRYRRSLYTFIQRTSPYGQLVNFDLAAPNRPCTRRERSNTPLQALNLLNDPNFFEAAQALAARSVVESPDPAARIDWLFRAALARPATPVERARIEALVREQTARFDRELEAIPPVTGAVGPPHTAENAAWVIAASVLLNLDEFINRE